MRLSLDDAQAVCAASIARAQALGVSISVSVVDESGFQISLARMPTAHRLSAQIAEAKASGCAVWQREGETLAEMADQRPDMFRQVDRFARLPLIPAKGSLLIRRTGDVIGAVGVSGAPTGDEDLICARAGLDAISTDG